MQLPHAFTLASELSFLLWFYRRIGPSLMELMLKHLTLSILILLAACQSNQPQNHTSAQFEIGEPIAQIEVTGAFKNLRLHVDGKDIFDPVKQDPSKSEAQNAERVFRFMSQSFFIWNAPNGLSLSEYLYGYGYGLCGMQSRVMSALWQEHGVDARIVAWPRHTMAEARVEGQWRIFDAQHRVDFSEINNHSVSFLDIQQKPSLTPEGLDPIGYHSSYLRDLFGKADVDYSANRDRLTRPNFSLKEGQTLKIRPRQSISDFTVPIAATPDTAKRTHVIPLYEVSIHHQFNGQPVTLHTGLPISGLRFNGSGPLEARVEKGQNHSGEPQEISAALSGETRPVKFQAKSGELVLVWHLAGWCGDRLFKAPAGAIVHAQTDHGAAEITPVSNNKLPRIHIESIDGFASLTGQQSLKIKLKWENIHSDIPLKYQIYLDELSSSLPLEAWQYVVEWQWVWDPETMGSAGETTLTKTWSPPINTSPYRPGHSRTLLAHLKGPGVINGPTNHLIRHYDFSQ